MYVFLHWEQILLPLLPKQYFSWRFSLFENEVILHKVFRTQLQGFRQAGIKNLSVKHSQLSFICITPMRFMCEI